MDATTRVAEDTPTRGVEAPGTRVRGDPGALGNTYNGNKGNKETETAPFSLLPTGSTHRKPPRRSVPEGYWDPFENYTVTPMENY